MTPGRRRATPWSDKPYRWQLPTARRPLSRGQLPFFGAQASSAFIYAGKG